MYFSSLKLFEVLKFFQFLMLFENQFLDTSSNFGAPLFHTASGLKNTGFLKLTSKPLTGHSNSIVLFYIWPKKCHF